MNERPAPDWEGHTAADLARRWGAPRVHLFTSLGSSNDVARRFASEGALAGTVVLAEEQLAGRGRAGRNWSSPPGLGLWFSVVAAPGGEANPSLLPLRIGLAVAQALDRFLPPPGVGIKWPNDLWVSGRKLGGILCEATWEGACVGTLVAGVGLNILHDSGMFPEEIRGVATSLRLESGSDVARIAIADRLIPAVLAAIRGGNELDTAALAEKDLLRGRGVVVTDPMTSAQIVEGVAEGVRDDGTLAVRDSAGRAHRISSGTVRTRV